MRRRREAIQSMTILDEAAEAVDSDREEIYGHPKIDFTRVTRGAHALGVDPLSGPLHHALYMILVKVSRLVNTPNHHDSIVDIAGYARTYERVLNFEGIEGGSEKGESESYVTFGKDR